MQQLRKQALSALRTLLSLGATLWTYPPQGEASDSYLQSVTGAKHKIDTETAVLMWVFGSNPLETRILSYVSYMPWEGCDTG